MSTEITQSQFNISNQPIRNLHAKIQILNYAFAPLTSVEGNVISGNITVDANSDLRRSCHISMVVTDNSFKVEAGGKIFLDRLLQIYIGVDEMRTGEIIWNNMGIYLINQPSYSYDAETHTLNFDGIDLMALFTGQRNGYIAGLAGEDIALLQEGQNVRELIIAILKQNGFTRYVVSECKNANGVIQPVPFNIEFNQGSTWYDILSTLRDILPQYQMYFDVDGVFHYELIPSSDADPIRIDINTWQNNVLSETVNVDFESVKNSIEVYGITHNTELFSDVTTTTVTDNAIDITVSSEAYIITNTLVSFVLPEDATGNLTLNVNETGAKNFVDSNGDFITELEADTYWVAKYQEDETWLFMGHLQAQGKWEDTNPNSPFYIGGSVGKIVLPLYGGEYDNIQSDDLAQQRANYEGYKRCRLNDSIQLNTIPIYWGDVNWKVNYAPLGSDTVNQYIVQSIRTDLSETGSQTWDMSRFYSFYPVL